MAPMYPDNNLVTPTLAIATGMRFYCAAGNCSDTYKPQETKKQRILRISREKMRASWMLYNQKTVTIIEVLQRNKPCLYYKK